MLVLRREDVSNKPSPTQLFDNETNLNVTCYLNSGPMVIYSIPLIASIGLLLNLTCVFVFSNESFKENMYKYLKFRSSAICVHLFIQLFRPIEILKADFSSLSLITIIYHLYFLDYVISSLEMIIIVLNILYVADFYLIVSNRKENSILSKVSYKYKISAVLVFSFLSYLLELIGQSIRSFDLIELNQNGQIVEQRKYYALVSNPVGLSIYRKVISNIVILVRDFVNLIALICLNALVFYRVKKSIKRKRLTLKKSTISRSSSNNNVDNHRISKTERKITLMTILSSLTYVSTRLPLLFTILISNYGSVDLWSHWFGQFTVNYLYASFLTDILFFYFFNDRFKRVFDSYLLILKR